MRPEQVSAAMEEIASDMREGLLALAVGAALRVMAQLMKADVTAVCGPKGRHGPDRTATRHGTERGSVTRAGRQRGCGLGQQRLPGGQHPFSVRTRGGHPFEHVSCISA